jgi:hypothetical protein
MPLTLSPLERNSRLTWSRLRACDPGSRKHEAESGATRASPFRATGDYRRALRGLTESAIVYEKAHIQEGGAPHSLSDPM